MVSVNRYFKAFVHVMPKRMKIVSRLVKEKRRLDKRIIAGDRSKQTISEWKYIVGEDTLFRSAEKKDKQSLRHYIYKTIKGLEALTNFDKMTEASMQDPGFQENLKSDVRRLGVYETLLDLLEKRAQYVQALKNLDASLIRQINNVQDYKAFVEEYEIQKEIRNSMKSLPNNIAMLQRNLRGILERTRKLGKLDIVVGLAIICLTLIVLTAVEFGWDTPPSFIQEFIAYSSLFIRSFLAGSIVVGTPYLTLKISKSIIDTIRQSI